MKIGIVIDSIIGKGGVQKVVFELTKGLIKKGHEVKIYTYYWDKENYYDDLNQNFEIISLYKNKDVWKKQAKESFIQKLISLFFTFDRESKKLSKLISNDIEFLNLHDKCHRVAYYLKNKKTLAMLHDLPLSQWNAQRFEKKISTFNKLLRKIKDNTEKSFLKNNNAILVLDKNSQKVLKKLTDLDSHIIRNGIDDKYIKNGNEISKATIENKPDIKILCIGILMQHRRFEDVIKALNLLENKNITLDIIGLYNNEDPYKKMLDELIESNKLNNRVKFYGEIPEEEIMKKYTESDLFIFPNHIQTWGLVVFEAMANKLPVIISKTAGASEILTDKDNALFVDPKSPKQIAQHIKSLKENPKLYSKISENGFNFVRNNLSWSKYTDKIIKHLNEIK